MKQKVVVIGFGFTSRLGMVRSLAKIGVEITIISLDNERHKPIDRVCKYVSHIYYCHGNKADELLHIIDNCRDENQKVILIPLNDFSASVIDKNTEFLKNDFLFPNIHYKANAVTNWMNKERQKELANSLGLNVASAVTVEIKDGKYQLPTGIHYPCFTKTRTYVSGYKQTLNKCSNEKELHKILDFFCSKFHALTVMIEDYKEIETEYAVVGFTDGKEVIIPGVIEILAMAKGNDKGVALQGKIMPITGYEDLIEKFKKVMIDTEFIGLFDIDFYKSEGRFYFGEINMRIGGSGYAIMKKGVNLPAMLVASLRGEPIGEVEKEIKSTGIFVNERICIDNWYANLLTQKELKHLLYSSNISFLRDEEDPAPEKLFKRRLAIKKIKKQLKTILSLKQRHDANNG